MARSLGLALGLLAAQAGAQSSNQTVQRNLPSREQVTPPTPVTDAPPANARVDARGAVAVAACPFEASPIRFRLARVVFTRADGSPLQPVIARALAGIDRPAAGEQSIRVVCDVRDAANAALRRAGWIASVQVPAQTLGGGELTLHVVTARLVEVRVRGEPGPFRRTLARRVERLRALDPLNEHDAERALLLANDVPGLDVQLSLRPAGSRPGDVIGDLTVTYRPFAILANAQNYNASLVGRNTIYVRGELYGLTGLSDLTYLGASASTDGRQEIAQVGHILGVGRGGTTLGGRFTYAWSRPDLGALALDTDTLIAGLDVVHPLIRRVRETVRIAAGLDYVDQSTRVGASGGEQMPLNLDKLRIGYLRASGDLVHRRFDGTPVLTVRGGVEVRRGLGILGATPRVSTFTGGVLPSRIEGDSQALVLRGDLDAVALLGRRFSLAATVRAQWADRPLLNYEELSIGNLTIGRGYDPGSNSGDRAVGARIEPRVALPFGVRAPTELFGFYDHVRLTNLDTNSSEVDRTLRSWGGGARVTLPTRLVLDLMYAKPLDRALTIDKEPPPGRFLASLIVQWRGGVR